MQAYFWGTRGSLPVGPEGAAIRKKITQVLLKANGRRFDGAAAVERFIDSEVDFPLHSSYGGNSSCMQIIGGNQFMVCDMGSGLRCLGQHVMREYGPARPQIYNFFMSHVHWDHIMGFPFFPPVYIPGNAIHIYGGHPVAVLEEAFHRQQSAPCFPVSWDRLGASIDFVHLDTERWYDINGFRVGVKRQPHPGDSYGYRFEQNGKALVYSTDAEHKLQSESETAGMVDFYRNADLVVFDAMYSLSEMMNSKEDWGHSSNVIGVDLCVRARAKHYCMFHHDPVHDDETLHAVLGETRRYAEIAGEDFSLRVSSAYDGLVIDV
jgi:phosphoribosyl 1,2-cyclic phosphodiesterase